MKIILMPSCLINHLCIEFSFQETKLFVYLFEIIKTDNQFNKKKMNQL